jgi:hypothetical protein
MVRSLTSERASLSEAQAEKVVHRQHTAGLAGNEDIGRRYLAM